MSKQALPMRRRQFLKTAVKASAAFMVPHVVPGSALGLDGAIAPSERIVMGGIGIGNRGTYDLGVFLAEPDVQFVAVCDVKAARRTAIRKMVNAKYGNQDCDTYRDLRELLARADIDAVLIATGPNWHAAAATLAANAGKDMYCEKPCTKNVAHTLSLSDTIHRSGVVFQAGTQRRNIPHFAFACELARTGRLGKLRAVHAHPDFRPVKTEMSGWATPESVPDKEVVDWDMYLGPAPWRPFNRAHLDGFNFEKGGGLVGGGVLEWGSHCVDLCQWAVDDQPCPVEYNPPADGRIVARYANGVELVFRREGWIPLGSCPVRFEGDDGWVEAGDSGKFVLSSPELLGGREVPRIGGYPATFHVRDFLNAVKARSKPKGNIDAARNAHLACHAANVALFLDRKVTFDNVKNEFVDDEEANRLRSEAVRPPWTV